MSFADKFVRLSLGFALFVPINIVILIVSAEARSPVHGFLFVLLTAALAYLFHRKRMTWQGAGLGVGFGIMTIVTGGTCTLFTSSYSYGEVGGLWYLAVTIAFFVVAGIAKVFAPPPPRPGA